jgi:hypothetical protein
MRRIPLAVVTLPGQDGFHEKFIARERLPPGPKGGTVTKTDQTAKTGYRIDLITPTCKRYWRGSPHFGRLALQLNLRAAGLAAPLECGREESAPIVPRSKRI